jgi:glycosyltransferase involved in cell wall biosynthesis
MKGIRKVEPNLYRFSPLVIPLYRFRVVRHINKRLLRFFILRFLRRKGFHTIINWASCPTAADTCGYLGELGSVYYVGDEFSEFTQFEAGLVGRLERRLLVRSDVLFVVSEKLLETKSQFNPMVDHLPHGCDYEFFSTASNMSHGDVPADLRKISGPIIGYYGLIRDWFDFRMLADVFSRRTDWSLVLVGPKDTDTSEIDHLSNVHLLGYRPYEQLPAYLRGFDVAVIPYRHTEITEAANPLKLLEYLASGVPVVSTDLPSVRPFADCIHTADGADSVERAIEVALEDRTPERIEHRRAVARGNSWQSGIDKVEEQLERHIYPRLRPSPKRVILHVVAAMNIAGAERVILNTVAAGADSEFEHRVVSYVREDDGAGSAFLVRAHGLGAVIDHIPLAGRSLISDIRFLKQLISRHQPVVVHSHGYRADLAAAGSIKRKPVRHIITAHGYVGKRDRLSRYEALGRRAARRADRVIAVSDDIRRILLESGVSASKIAVLSNAIDFDSYTEAPEIDLRSNWQLGEHDFVIGTAGRLSAEKSQASLLEAVNLLPDEIRAGCRVVIAGEGPLRDFLETRAEDLGLSDRVHLAGFVADMPSFYRALDLFCLPSLTEGLPLTILEAAASGCPVIASRVGAVPELVTHGRNGWLIDPADSRQLADAIAGAFRDRESRMRLGAKLRDDLRESYDISRWIERLHDIYRDVLLG